MKSNGEGYIEDVSTAHKYPIRWAGNWGSSRDKSKGIEIGCFISFEDMPKLHLTVDGIYHVKFTAHKTKKYNYEHTIDMFCKLWGTDYIEEYRVKKIRHHIKFLEVSPLEACEKLHIQQKYHKLEVLLSWETKDDLSS